MATHEWGRLKQFAARKQEITVFTFPFQCSFSHVSFRAVNHSVPKESAANNVKTDVIH